MSLVGIVVSVAVLATLMAPLAGLLSTGKDSFARGTCLVRLQESGRWVLERIEHDLREGRIDPDFEAEADFVVGAASSSITLNPRNPDDYDWAAGRVAWERNEKLRYALAIDSGENENGADDDRDGLIDECRISRVVDDGSGEVWSTDLARNVPSGSLRFERVDERRVRVSFMVSGRAERSELITAAMSMDVFLRN